MLPLLPPPPPPPIPPPLSLLLRTMKPQSVTLLIRQGHNGGLMFMIDRRPTQVPKHNTNKP
jgi:hypothetical protein